VTNPLGPSWKPKVAAILTLIGPAGLLYILTTYVKMDVATATQFSGGLFVLLASYGLYNAKQAGVSNSPTPLLAAHDVTTASVVVVAPPSIPSQPPQLIINPLLPTAEKPHLI
jgi:hypothetical protein